MPEKYSVYFSHSWRPDDVDLNQAAWSALCEDCNLLVDNDLVAKPPYFISRIEEYIRRSDLFLAILTYREEPSARVKEYVALAGTNTGDCEIRCSEASLFEVRLAERARKPRLILYDPQTGFVPGAESGNQVRYAAFEPLHVTQHRSTMADDIKGWLRFLRENNFKPRFPRPNQNALLLLGPSYDDEASKRIAAALKKGSYSTVREVEGNWTDAQVVSALMSSSLLVADVAEAEVWDLYAMAHALFVPTIRLARSAGAAELPRLLRGHPYGYQADLVRWSSVDDLAAAIAERAAAMRDTRRVIDNYEVGRDFLERRRFPQQHHVFISHNLKGKDREVIKGIVKALKERSITSWEYGDHNRSGDKWRAEMDEALETATHAVVILSDDYEMSTPCDTELTALDEKNAILLPFFYGGRNKPNPRIDRRGIHIETLPSDLKEAGNLVASRVVDTLTQQGS